VEEFNWNSEACRHPTATHHHHTASNASDDGKTKNSSVFQHSICSRIPGASKPAHNKPAAHGTRPPAALGEIKSAGKPDIDRSSFELKLFCAWIFFQILDGLTGGVGLSAKAHFNSSATGADSLNEAYTYVYRTGAGGG
jgi:hypothetical protein